MTATACKAPAQPVRTTPYAAQVSHSVYRQVHRRHAGLRGESRRRRSAQASAQPDTHVRPQTAPIDGPSATGNSAQERRAVLQATKRVSRPMREEGRPLAEYMTLPASQYSVLDAKRIDRIDEHTFRCYVDGIRFLGLTIEPVITVSVTVGDRGPTVKLLDTRLEGSPAVQSANDRFSATMTNVVHWTASEQLGHKDICSDTSIQVTLEVPGWMNFIPRGAVENLGSKAMQGVLNTMVPRFLAQLHKDYARWAAGDESRSPVSTGQI